MPPGTVSTSIDRIYRNTGCHSLPELLLKFGNRGEGG